MKLRRIVLAMVLVAFVLGAGLLATMRPATADASDALQSVLSNIRFMLSSDFGSLEKWARNGTPAPDHPSFNLEKTEAAILDLSSGDRNAVLYWLQGHGRSALYAQGASDSEIGPKRDVDSGSGSGPATPNPWRDVPLATSSLEGGPQGPIQILGGFAAVKRDGTSGIACLSFKNVAPKVANHILFEFPLFGENGQELGKIELDRHGEFSPNIDIVSFNSMAQWQNTTGGGPRGSYAEGCIQRNLPTAALPFLQARATGYHVVHVDFADGSSWPPAAAPPAAAPAAPPAAPPPAPAAT